MTDIVERLRDCSKYGAYQQGQPGRLMGEAAAEIERLRAALQEVLVECDNDCWEFAVVEEIARRALEPKP